MDTNQFVELVEKKEQFTVKVVTMAKNKTLKKNGIPMECPTCGRGSDKDIASGNKPWIYKGKSKFYCNCPCCHTTVNIQRNRKDSKREVK